MTLLVLHLWPGFAAALVLGLVAGALAGRPGRWTVAAHLAALAGLAGAAALVPGRPGLWLEGAAGMLGLYLAAAAAALALRRAGIPPDPSRPETAPAQTPRGSYSSVPQGPPASPS